MSQRPPTLDLRPTLLLWTGIALVAGLVGGALCIRFGLPFSLGFFFGFTLLGMAGLFVLAARVANRPRG